MVYFNSDYMVGAHPEVLARLIETNAAHTVGYGDDEYTARARELILKRCGIPSGNVFFMVGGTQTNAVVIDRLTDRNDGVLAADTAHIAVHEAGAIELTGHKVITLPDPEGKLRSDAIDRYMSTFYSDETNPHMVRPALVYLSFPTELGLLYSKQELEDIYNVCRQWNMLLYIDGARMAYGLASPYNNLELSDIARLSDAFYIGGTKCGALFGEAVVTRRPELFNRFISLMKMHGALLAKGRLLGVQFETLFDSDLYERIGRHAVDMAFKLKEIFTERGYRAVYDSPTNQQFFQLPNDVIECLKNGAAFELWGAPGLSDSTVRFVTDWSTTPASLDALASLL